MLLKFADHLKPSKSLKRFHKGIVVDNEDPDKLGRVKCTVSRMFIGDKANLPWVFPKNDSPVKFDVPKLGAELIIIFPFENIYAPFHDGYWHTLDNHNDYFDDDYPNTSGFFKENLKGKFNDKSKAGEVEHSSGTKAELADDGSVTVAIAKDLELTIEGKYAVNAKGDMTFATDAKISFAGAGGLDYTTDGNAVFKGTGGTDVGDASSATNVKGSVVNLAGGGSAIALLGSQCIGSGNHGAPVVSNIVEGSSKVFAPK